MTRFQQILPDVLKHEGGYVDHPADPGGATMQGVTLETFRRFYGRERTKSDLRNITRAQLETIYRQGYWSKVRAEQMWPGLDRAAFDAAVNSGPSRGLRWVQVGVGARPDGAWGPETASMVRGLVSTPERVKAIQRACAARMGFLRGLRHWSTFGRGWSRRVAEVEAKATQEAGMGPSQRRVEAEKARQVGKGQEGAAGASGGSPLVLWGVDVPWEVLVPLGVFLIFAVFVLIQKARHNRNRAAAYEALTMEAPQ